MTESRRCERDGVGRVSRAAGAGPVSRPAAGRPRSSAIAGHELVPEPRRGADQTLPEGDLRLPPQDGPGQRYVGPPLPWVVLGQGLEDDLRARTGAVDHVT